MIILIEGPDGVGKTTLALKLKNLYSCEYIHSPTVSDVESYYKQLILKIYSVKEQGGNLVIDRASISNKIYTTVFGDTTLLSNKSREEFENNVDLIIYCLPYDREEYLNTFNQLKNNRWEKYQQMGKIYDEFEKEYELNKSNNKVMRYDYRHDSVQTIIARVEKKVNIDGKNWVCFFSQTGSEINEVSKKLNKDPSLIITNSLSPSKFNKELVERFKDKIIFIPAKPTLSDYNALFLKYKDIFNNCFITLHGYLRIIPKELCNSFVIYNLHPGLITKYPELKGFNPQEKAYNLRLPTSGSVIHRVIEQVDSGDILYQKEVFIQNKSLDYIYSILHDISTDLWVEFLGGKND